MRTHPRVSHLSDTRQVAGAINAALSSVENTTPTSVADFGARGDGQTNDTAAIQAAINAINAEGGGTLFFPPGHYLITSYITLCQNLRILGSGQKATWITTAMAGGGGADASEDVRNGTAFFGDWPSNSSTSVHFCMEHLSLFCSNASNVGAGFYDNCGTVIQIRNCTISGFKYGIIFDQTELADVSECYVSMINGGGACFWLVNGASLRAGNVTGVTNRLSIAKCQINGTATDYGILDDGGTCHSFVDNNYNACLTHVRVAGATAGIRGGEFESAAGPCIVIGSTALDGHNVGGSSLSVTGPALFSSGNGQPCVDCESGAGTLQLDGGVTLTGGGGTVAAMVTNADQLFELYLGVVGVDAFGSPPLYDAEPTHLIDVRKLGFPPDATAPGTSLVAIDDLSLRATVASTADGDVATLALDHGGSGGQAYIQSLVHTALAYSEMLFRTRHADGMGERLRVNETGIVIPSANGVYVGADKVVGAQQAAIANDASGAANQATVNAILAALRTHGLIDT